MSNTHPQDPAELIARITPEDGAVDGKLRDDWEDICRKTADYFIARRRELAERATEAALRDAIAFRSKLLNNKVIAFPKQLLSNNGDKNDG